MQFRLVPVALILILAAASSRAADTAAPTTLPSQKVRIPTTTITFDMVKLPAGLIQLPPEKAGQPARIEKIKPIWIATTETTWEPFITWAYGHYLTRVDRGAARKDIDARLLPSERPYEDPSRGWGTDGTAALSMTYHCATMYCNWLSRSTGQRFRLPTEAEWEYACRAGGPPLANLDEKTADSMAWYGKNSATADFPDGRTHPVARKKANPWGLYDILGNVAEWVDKGNADVPFAKGGSFRSKQAEVNSSDRLYYRERWQIRDPQDPKDRWWLTDAPFVGFRVVCDDDPPATRPAAR